MNNKVLALSFVLLLTGCAEEEAKLEAESVAARATEDNIRWEPKIWTDEETGCDYLLRDTGMNQGGVAITPRMKSDGTQYCDCVNNEHIKGVNNNEF